MKHIFWHTNKNDFSAQKPTLLKKQPNFICLKLNFEQKTRKSRFFCFLQPCLYAFILTYYKHFARTFDNLAPLANIQQRNGKVYNI